MSTNWLDDPWLKGANLDTSGMSSEDKAALAAKQGRKQSIFETGDVWGANPVPEVIKSESEELREMLSDPEIRRELAERDPVFAQKYEEEQIEAVVTEFRRANRDYIPTDRNSETVIQALARKYLQKDWLSNDEAAASLFKLGKWTVAELTAQFKQCLRAGAVDIRRGTTRQLSTDEKADVISLIRIGDLNNAIVQFITYAFGGNLPHSDYADPRDLMKRHPALARQAVEFVWYHTKPGLDPVEFNQFKTERLTHIQIPTLGLVEQAWSEWQDSRTNQRRYPHLFGGKSQAESEPEPQPPQTREQLEESFTDVNGQFDELAFNRHYVRALKQRAAAR
jgi:hypothetical protein